MQPSESPLPPAFLDPSTAPFPDEYGVWNAFSAEDVRWVLKHGSRDPSSWLGPGEHNPVVDFLWLTEDFTPRGGPGRHAVLRGVAADWFSTRAARAMGPAIRDITLDLLERIITSGNEAEGRFNLAEFAYAVPLRIVCSLAGMPLGDEQWLRGKQREVNRAGYASIPPQPEVRKYFLDLAKAHRGKPGDLFTALVAAHEDGTIAEEELAGYLYGLTMAATDTTGTHLANIFSIAAERNLLGALREITGDRGRLYRAVTEFLRFTVPFPAKLLGLPSGAVLSGQEIPAESVARVWFSAACRDIEVNGGVQQASPHELSLGRWPNRHLALGAGPHYCMGADLQAQEAMTVVTLALQLLPGLRPAPGDWFRRDLVNRESILHEVAEAWFIFDRGAAIEALHRYRDQPPIRTQAP